MLKVGDYIALRNKLIREAINADIMLKTLNVELSRLIKNSRIKKLITTNSEVAIIYDRQGKIEAIKKMIQIRTDELTSTIDRYFRTIDPIEIPDYEIRAQE